MLPTRQTIVKAPDEAQCRGHVAPLGQFGVTFAPVWRYLCAVTPGRNAIYPYQLQFIAPAFCIAKWLSPSNEK